MTREKLVFDRAFVSNDICDAEIISYLRLSRHLPDVLSNITRQKIIARTASKAKITLKEREIEQAVDRFWWQNNLVDAGDTLKWLEKNQLSNSEFEESIANILLAQKLARHLFEDQVEAYFSSNRSRYYKTIFYEIILGDRNLAFELFYSLQEQETSFWDLARQYNKDNELRRRCGYRGIQTGDRLHLAIASAIFSQSEFPALLKPITIAKSTHLIYLEDIIAPKLNTTLRQEIIERLFKKWLEQQVRNQTHTARHC